MVRDAAKPVDHRLTIYVERRTAPPRLADGLMEAAVSLCQAYVDQPFRLMWSGETPSVREITGEELTAGKEALLSSLRATSDSPGAIEGYYATAHLSGLNMTPERYMEVVEKVSLADVVAAARTVTLHSTYFLKGESQ